MISTLLVSLWLGISVTSAGPVPHVKFHALKPRQLNSTEPSLSLASSAPLPSVTGQSGKVPAIGNNPNNKSRISFSSISQVAQATSAAVSSPTSSIGASISAAAAVASVSPISGASSNSTASPKQIGIVQAIPNNPGRSPPLNSIPAVDPAKLSAISADLASINGAPAAQTAQAAVLNITLSSSVFLVLASVSSPTPSSSGQIPSISASATSRVFVSATTFPLLGDPNPPVVSISSSSPVLVAASASASVSAISSIPTSSAIPSAQRGPHSHSKNRLRSKATLSASSPTPDLVVPNLMTLSATPESTITIQASSQPSGVAIIPFDPNAPCPAVQNANASGDPVVTVTVTQRIAETTKFVTQTITLI